jgi:hypothetical protein
MRYGFVRLAAVAVLVVAGCGGSGTAGPTAASTAEAPAAQPSTAGNGGSGSGGQPSAEASVAEVATQAPAPSSGGGAGGGPAVGICELVTADELAGIYGVASVTTTVIPGPPDNCIVQSDSGDGLTAWSLMTAQAETVFSAMTVDPSTVMLSGIGDKAAIVQNTGILVVKGNSLLSVALTAAPDMSEEEVLAAAKQVATLAAGRL